MEYLLSMKTGIPGPGCASALLAETVGGWPWRSVPAVGARAAGASSSSLGSGSIGEERKLPSVVPQACLPAGFHGHRGKKREWNQMKLFSCGELLGQLCSRTVKPSCSGWGDTVMGIAILIPRIRAGSKEW